MPPSEQPRVFISYARKDGAALAQRLQQDLKAQGLDAWLDTQRIGGGRVWGTQIEREIDARQVTVAVLTDGSYKSGMCRGEQIRAMRKGKRLIPVLGTKGVDIPVYIEALHYRDFTEETNYSARLAELLADIRGDAAATLPDTFQETNYVTVPPLPVNFVERPEALDALRDALLADDGGRHIALTALQGMGGIGKTVLAQALCHDEVVQQAFPDGVVWITIGRESPFDPLTRMREVGKALGDDLSRYENELAAKNQYRSTIRKKAALIVVDDVWRSSDLETLRAEDSPRSRLLFTTRDASIAAAMGAREHVADLLTNEQSREVLARWSRTEITHLPPISAELIHECGRLPLALSMVGAMLRGKPAAYWKAVLEHLRNADLDKIKAQFPDYPYTDVLRAIQVSVDSLDATSRARYFALAVLLEEMAAAPPVQQCLWGVDENQAAETAEQFVSLSLAQRDQPEGSIRLHDLQLDYVRAQYPNKDKEALDLIHGALRLSSNVIAKDPAQFASQMVGRLLPHLDKPAIERFTDRAIEAARTPWMRPLQPALHPPGTGLLRTLAGHTSSVNGVALSGDGRIAVSASGDNTLKVWDLSSGRELRTLDGHTNWVYGVALSGDGRIAVSASWDKTLKVWEVGSGRELRTLAGHTSYVYGVALSGDGRIAVSASWDQTLKVWEVGSGRELRTLGGHTDYVNGVALSGDGRLAVSASADQTLKVWEVGSGRELRTLAGHTSSVRGVALSGDGRIAVSASGDKTLKVWEVGSGRELRTLAGHTSSIRGVALSEDGRIAVSTSDDHTLKVWDLSSGRELRTLTGHTKHVNAAAVAPDGQRAVSASGDHTLKVWDLSSGRELRTLTGHTEQVYAVAVTPDGQRAVSASEDHTLKVWEVGSGRELRTFTGHSNVVTAVAVTPDGQRAVSASWDKTLKVWDMGSGRELRTLLGHTNEVIAVAVTPDGRRAVSASWDNTVKVWDLESGQVLATFTCDSAATCCAFSETLNLILAGDAGGHLHFLRLEEPKPKS
jgi:WD40 repeat protein